MKKIYFHQIYDIDNQCFTFRVKRMVNIAPDAEIGFVVDCIWDVDQIHNLPDTIEFEIE